MGELLLLAAGAAIGGVAGYFLGKTRALQNNGLDKQFGIIQGLAAQIAEMKGKFEAVETEREKINRARELRRQGPPRGCSA